MATPVSPRATTETPYERIVRERHEDRTRSRVSLYDIDRSIGEGNFAKVKLGVHCLTQTKVAIKIVDKTKLSEAALQKLTREVKLMKLLNHPHICRLYEVIETQNELYLIMEYAEGGEVFDYLVVHVRMKERDARRYFRQLVSAIDYCHSRQVIHRDLKAENLLMDDRLNAKIADFGFSNQFTPGQQLSTWCGSPPYAAPELFQGKQYTGPEVDIWSLGVVLYVLVCGSLPFDGSSLPLLRSRVLNGKIKVPYYMSPECERLIKRMLVVDPTKRATMEDIKNDPWLNDGYDAPLGPPGSAEIVVTPEVREIVLDMMTELGISRDMVNESFANGGFDSIAGTYHLLCDVVQRREPVDHRGSPAPARKPRTQGLAADENTPSTNSTPPAAGLVAGTSFSLPRNMKTAPALSPPAAASGLTTSPTSTPVPVTPTGSAAIAVSLLREKRERRHTSNANTATARIDVDAMRKEILRKRLSGSDQDGGEGVTAVAGSSSTSTSPSWQGSSNEASSLATRLGKSLTVAIPENAPLITAPATAMPLSRAPPTSSRSNLAHSADSTTASAATPAAPPEKKKRARAFTVSSTTPRQSASPTPPSPTPMPLSQPSLTGSSATMTSAPTMMSSPSLFPRQKSPRSAGAPVPESGSASLSSTTAAASAAAFAASTAPQPGKVSFTMKLRNRFRSNSITRDAAATEPREPRNKLFQFSVHTTSSKDPQQLILEVHRAVAATDIAAERTGFVFTCSRDDVKFELEICKLSRLSMNGIRFKRISGDQWQYKQLCATVLSKMQL